MNLRDSILMAVIGSNVTENATKGELSLRAEKLQQIFDGYLQLRISSTPLLAGENPKN